MKVTVLDGEKEMVEVTIAEAQNYAAVDPSDSDMVRDCKLYDWIGRRRHRCITVNPMTYSAEIEQAQADGIDLIITKET